MNLLTPNDASKMHHVNIETGQVVSSWTFAKVGGVGGGGGGGATRGGF